MFFEIEFKPRKYPWKSLLLGTDFVDLHDLLSEDDGAHRESKATANSFAPS